MGVWSGPPEMEKALRGTGLRSLQKVQCHRASACGPGSLQGALMTADRAGLGVHRGVWRAVYGIGVEQPPPGPRQSACRQPLGQGFLGVTSKPEPLGT